MYNVAVDVGGTFTDVLVFDEETGGLTEGKVLSTPEDPSKGVVEGIETVCEKVGISFPDLHLFFHGTTVVTNMILTNTGSRVGLLTTKGHEQILHRSEEHTSELQSRQYLVCRLLLEKKKNITYPHTLISLVNL